MKKDKTVVMKVCFLCPLDTKKSVHFLASGHFSVGFYLEGVLFLLLHRLGVQPSFSLKIL